MYPVNKQALRDKFFRFQDASVLLDSWYLGPLGQERMTVPRLIFPRYGIVTENVARLLECTTSSISSAQVRELAVSTHSDGRTKLLYRTLHSGASLITAAQAIELLAAFQADELHAVYVWMDADLYARVADGGVKLSRIPLMEIMVSRSAESRISCSIDFNVASLLKKDNRAEMLLVFVCSPEAGEGDRIVSSASTDWGLLTRAIESADGDLRSAVVRVGSFHVMDSDLSLAKESTFVLSTAGTLRVQDNAELARANASRIDLARLEAGLK